MPVIAMPREATLCRARRNRAVQCDANHRGLCPKGKTTVLRGRALPREAALAIAAHDNTKQRILL